MIKVQNLYKNFETGGNQLKVLEDINFQIKTGERIAILGASGGGKSTLLRILANLEQPTSGTVTTSGHRVGMVFQEYYLFPDKTVLQNLTLPLEKINHLSRKAAKVRAINLLASLDIEALANMLPAQLSGGQKQRVAILRALSVKPDVLLLDEPTSALDRKNSQVLLEILDKLHNRNMTLIMVSHDLAVAEQFADRVLFMKAGRLVSDGPADAFFSSTAGSVKEFLLS